MLLFRKKHVSLDKKKLFVFFVSFFLIYFAFSLPIIRANITYIDDHRRVMLSDNRFILDGRVFSEFLLRFLFFFNHHVSDVTPLFQFLAIAVLAFASALLAIAWNCNILSGLLALPFIVCSPFYIQNLSYRFDSITMALASTCAMTILGLRPYLTKLGYFTCATFLSFSIYNFYQSTSNLFIVLACTSSIFLLKDYGIKRALNEFFLNISIFLVSSFLYKVELPFIKKNSYIEEHSTFSLSYHTVVNNLFHFYENVSIGFWGKGLLGKSMGLMCITGLIILFVRIFLSKKRTNGTFGLIKYYGICISLILCEFLFIPGTFVFLQSPTYDFRFFTSMGGIYASFSLFIIGRNNNFHYFNKCLVFIAAMALYSNFLIVYAYGNAEIAQQGLYQHISEMLAEDLYDLVGNKPTTLFIDDLLPPVIAPRAQVLLNRYPILNHLLDTSLRAYDARGLLRAGGMPENVTIYTGYLKDSFGKMDLCHDSKINKKISHRYYDLYYIHSTVFLDYLHRCAP